NIFLKKADWYREKLIELIKLTRVTKLSAKEHKVTLESGEEIQYGKLLIAVGGFPLKLSVPGDDLENIHYLRTLEDADKFIESSKKGKKGVIVGGGLVSLDFAEGMRANGVEEVTILVREPYYWFGKLDRDSSRIIKSVLEKNGVAIAEGEEVDHFEGLGKVSKVVTKSQKSFDCDVVGVGIGIKSDFSWLEGSGIKIDRAIVTNEYLETSIEDIYAAGDCAQFHDVIFEREHIMGNWANATSQGAAVAKTMVGQRTVFESASFYSDTFFEGKYSFIGVVDDNFADKIISRGSVESGKMTRIFIKTIGSVMIIVGATVINNPANVAPLTSIIKKKVDVSAYKEKFVDLSFDLNDIL
ncbi:MAG: FAD-dependent oxidoreductase, partial [Candidatus Curtissbacteria bacterium]|nr:FAD-dependent oxidoreductase [Candidatus Curtissbacteria bacterium]